MIKWLWEISFQKFKMNTQEENNKYRQGRSKKQVKSSYIGAFIGIIGLIITMLLGFIIS